MVKKREGGREKKKRRETIGMEEKSLEPGNGVLTRCRLREEGCCRDGQDGREREIKDGPDSGVCAKKSAGAHLSQKPRPTF